MDFRIRAFERTVYGLNLMLEYDRKCVAKHQKTMPKDRSYFILMEGRIKAFKQVKEMINEIADVELGKREKLDMMISLHDKIQKINEIERREKRQNENT